MNKAKIGANRRVLHEYDEIIINQRSERSVLIIFILIANPRIDADIVQS